MQKSVRLFARTWQNDFLKITVAIASQIRLQGAASFCLVRKADPSYAKEYLKKL